MSAPTDVHVRRLSVTAVEVSWDPPAFHGVAGYRVQYAAMTDDDQRRPRFLDTGPYTVAQVATSNITAITTTTTTIIITIIIIIIVIIIIINIASLCALITPC